eukprot:GSA120T00006273001.1
MRGINNSITSATCSISNVFHHRGPGVVANKNSAVAVSGAVASSSDAIQTLTTPPYHDAAAITWPVLSTMNSQPGRQGDFNAQRDDSGKFPYQGCVGAPPLLGADQEARVPGAAHLPPQQSLAKKFVPTDSLVSAGKGANTPGPVMLESSGTDLVSSASRLSGQPMVSAALASQVCSGGGQEHASNIKNESVPSLNAFSDLAHSGRRPQSYVFRQDRSTSRVPVPGQLGTTGVTGAFAPSGEAMTQIYTPPMAAAPHLQTLHRHRSTVSALACGNTIHPAFGWDARHIKEESLPVAQASGNVLQHPPVVEMSWPPQCSSIIPGGGAPAGGGPRESLFSARQQQLLDSRRTKLQARASERAMGLSNLTGLSTWVVKQKTARDSIARLGNANPNTLMRTGGAAVHMQHATAHPHHKSGLFFANHPGTTQQHQQLHQYGPATSAVFACAPGGGAGSHLFTKNIALDESTSAVSPFHAPVPPPPWSHLPAQDQDGNDAEEAPRPDEAEAAATARKADEEIEWVDSVVNPMNVKIAVHSGPFAGGLIRSKFRMDYHLWGKEMRKTKKLVEICPPGRVLCSGDAAVLLQKDFQKRDLTQVELDAA